MKNRNSFQSSLAGLMLTLTSGAYLLGAEAYVIRFASSGGLLKSPCTYVLWRDHLTFHNTKAESATIRLLGVSNGNMTPSPAELVVLAGRTSSQNVILLSSWVPRVDGVPPYLWVNRLDVPDGVLVASRAEPAEIMGSPCFPGLSNLVHGSLALPVYRSLVEPNRPQIHLRSDLGSDEFGVAAPSRINVGIYNAGSSEASASIELRRACDDGVVERRVVTIPTNTIQQFFGFTNPRVSCAGGSEPPYPTYVVVTVNQPSFSYAITLSNEIPPFIPMSLAGG